MNPETLLLVLFIGWLTLPYALIQISINNRPKSEKGSVETKKSFRRLESNLKPLSFSHWSLAPPASSIDADKDIDIKSSKKAGRRVKWALGIFIIIVIAQLVCFLMIS